jgi:hypothetical protein
MDSESRENQLVRRVTVILSGMIPPWGGGETGFFDCSGLIPG